MIKDLDELVISAVTELFGTMLRIEMTRSTVPSEFSNGEQHVAGSVGFIGRATGVVYLVTTASFARQITATLLGLSEAEVKSDEMVNDAMGEMANMLVGHMKSRLSDRGMPCVLTIPSVVRGSNFSVEPTSSSEGHLFSFTGGGRQILVEFLAKPSEASRR